MPKGHLVKFMENKQVSQTCRELGAKKSVEITSVYVVKVLLAINMGYEMHTAFSVNSYPSDDILHTKSPYLISALSLFDFHGVPKTHSDLPSASPTRILPGHTHGALLGL